jgi:hypothetical protein
MIPMAITAPKAVVAGIRINIEATSSAIPVPILPQGSTPNVENIYTDSSAPVNLKNRVCNIINAGMMRRIHSHFGVFIFYFTYG